MSNPSKGRTDSPERHKDVSEVDTTDIKKQAFDIFGGDKNTDVVMIDGQAVPSVAKVIDMIIRNS